MVPAESPEASPLDSATPTAAQIRLAVEVLRRPRSGQTVEFESKAKLSARSDPRNFPIAHSTTNEFGRITEAMARTLREDDLDLLKTVVAAGLYEDTLLKVLCIAVCVCVRVCVCTVTLQCQHVLGVSVQSVHTLWIPIPG